MTDEELDRILGIWDDLTGLPNEEQQALLATFRPSDYEGGRGHGYREMEAFSDPAELERRENSTFPLLSQIGRGELPVGSSDAGDYSDPDNPFTAFFDRNNPGSGRETNLREVDILQSNIRRALGNIPELRQQFTQYLNSQGNVRISDEEQDGIIRGILSDPNNQRLIAEFILDNDPDSGTLPAAHALSTDSWNTSRSEDRRVLRLFGDISDMIGQINEERGGPFVGQESGAPIDPTRIFGRIPAPEDDPYHVGPNTWDFDPLAAQIRSPDVTTNRLDPSEEDLGRDFAEPMLSDIREDFGLLGQPTVPRGQLIATEAERGDFVQFALNLLTGSPFHQTPLHSALDPHVGTNSWVEEYGLSPEQVITEARFNEETQEWELPSLGKQRTPTTMQRWLDRVYIAYEAERAGNSQLDPNAWPDNEYRDRSIEPSSQNKKFNRQGGGGGW